MLFFDVNKKESFQNCIDEWYPFLKENLDPSCAHVLFVGNKIDELNVSVNSKNYESGSQKEFKEFDERLAKLKDSEKGTEFEHWIDWTYTEANNLTKVQLTVKRLLKNYPM